VKLLLTQTFDSVDKIARVRMPVLIAHGADDRYVPSRFSERLYEAAPEPKKLLLVKGGTHNNSMVVGNGEYKSALHEFFGLAIEAPHLQQVSLPRHSALSPAPAGEGIEPGAATQR
jgi:hypothetical protein